MTMASPSVTAVGWRLRFLNGELKGRTISLKPGNNLVGSSPECEVMLPGSDVLPRHLMITVGELVVSVQRLGPGSALVNGEEMQHRRSVVPTDVLAVGKLTFQIERTYQPAEQDDRMFAGPESVLDEHRAEGQAAAAAAEAELRSTRRRMAAAASVAGIALIGLFVLVLHDAAPQATAAASTVSLAAVEAAVSDFPEVQVVAVPHGRVSVKGFVESRMRKQALHEALAGFGQKAQVNVHAADELVDQARQYIGDPAVAITYSGQGRLVVTGTVEEPTVQQKIRRLAEDLHPAVLLYDKVQYRPVAQRNDDGRDLREQWASWQRVLPARMVSITENGDGLRHIQLSNGSRYFEGSRLESGAELERIGADGLVLRDGAGPPGDKQ